MYYILKTYLSLSDIIQRWTYSFTLQNKALCSSFTVQNKAFSTIWFRKLFLNHLSGNSKNKANSLNMILRGTMLNNVPILLFLEGTIFNNTPTLPFLEWTILKDTPIPWFLEGILLNDTPILWELEGIFTPWRTYTKYGKGTGVPDHDRYPGILIIWIYTKTKL